MTEMRLEGWYPVALERDIIPLRVVRSKIGDKPLVLWRDDEDQIHVWVDRCPHRSVRLSAGRNFGTYLEGIYHGWRFGKDGSVIGVPAEGYSAKPDICAEVLAVSVQSGFVFANPSRQKNAPTVDFKKNEILIRPMPIETTGDIVSSALSRWQGLRSMVTPTGERSCWVYGLLTPNSKETASDGIRRINGELNDLRKSLESGL
ncbi:MAG: Rieske 2Fe-2S domain-containing protein [Afipia felis]|nr:Rieske 2Fe-2S domain-containing protein [Afipia felis]